MKFRTAALAALFLSSLLPAGAAPKAPSQGMMQSVNAVITALNTGSAKPLQGSYAADASVVDEFAPYSWMGKNAGVRWFSDFAAFAKTVHLTNAKATAAAIKHWDSSGDRAYLVVPVKLTATMGGKPADETGTLTLTLQRSGGKWLILTQTWGTLTETM